MKFLRELYNRFTLESPKFFKVLQKLGIIASSVSIGLLAIPEVTGDIKKIAGYLLAFSIGVAATAKTPVIDSDVKDLDK